MYENEYENYMRSVLGYPTNNTYNINSFPYRSNNNIKNNYEHLYPDIYKQLKPIVGKICNNVRSMDISPEIVEDMTNEIYNNIESSTMDVRKLPAETENSLKNNEMDDRGKSDYRYKTNNDSNIRGGNTASNNYSKNSNNTGDCKSNCNNSTANKDVKVENCGNPMLKDLIKILVVTQLINNSNNRPPRPPQCPPRPNCRDIEGYPPYYSNNFYGEF